MQIYDISFGKYPNTGDSYIRISTSEIGPYYIFKIGSLESLEMFKDALTAFVTQEKQNGEEDK